MAEVIQVTAPESEPVTLAEAKAQALYESDDQDDTLNLMIAAARRKAEEYLSAQLIHAIWELYLDKFPETIYLPRPPAVSISQITYIDSNGDEQTLDASAYRFTKGSPARIVPVYATTWPTARNTTHAVTVRYVCGYGLTGSATPPDCEAGDPGPHRALFRAPRHRRPRPQANIRRLGDRKGPQRRPPNE